MIKAEIRRAKSRARNGDMPACDLGYCECGTVWNMVALQQAHCPDCGEDPIHVVRGRAIYSLLVSKDDVTPVRYRPHRLRAQGRG